jgi:hypothetical protein
MDLDTNIRLLEVFVKFSALANQSNKKSSWCDDIELFIEYGTKVESLPGT